MRRRFLKESEYKKQVREAREQFYEELECSYLKKTEPVYDVFETQGIKPIVNKSGYDWGLFK